MKDQEYVYSGRLVVLMVANTALDYAAICEYNDVEPFKLSGFGIGNLISATVSLGIALVLAALAQRASTARVEGKAMSSNSLLFACAAASAVVAGFRAAFEGTSGTQSIGGGSGGITTSNVLFALMLFLMLAGEAAVAYLDRTAAYRREADILGATLERIRLDIKNIDLQVETAAREANERMLEAISLVNAADEAILEEALRHAGEMQSAFVGYVAEAEKARERHNPELAERVEELLIDVDDPWSSRILRPGKWQASTTENNAA